MVRVTSRAAASASNAPVLSYAAMAIGVVALALSLFVFLSPPKIITRNVTTTANATFRVTGFNITSSLITPPLVLPDSPVVTAQQPPGNRITGINAQLNGSELAAINGAPSSYFQTAGQMYLNGTIQGVGRYLNGFSPNRVPPFVVNGKPSVIYVGSTTCIFCGENRWAMALALSRFGNFSTLFKGYSSLGDYDVPTLYWAPAHYNYSSTQFGSFYSSPYINFLAIEDANPISGGFVLNPISLIQQRTNATGNKAYIDAFLFVEELSRNMTTAFQGTPYTIWGNYEIGGADGVDFFGSSPTQMAAMSHGQVLAILQHPNSTSAWQEYAAADIYIALTCGSIGNKAPICSLPAIQAIERSG